MRMKAYQNFLKMQGEPKDNITLENAIPTILFSKIPQLFGKGTQYINNVIGGTKEADSKKQAVIDGSSKSALLHSDFQDYMGKNHGNERQHNALDTDHFSGHHTSIAALPKEPYSIKNMS